MLRSAFSFSGFYSFYFAVSASFFCSSWLGCSDSTDALMPATDGGTMLKNDSTSGGGNDSTSDLGQVGPPPRQDENLIRTLFPESAWNTFTEQSRNEPGCRESEESRQALGLSDLPNGQWYYTYENMIKGMLLVPSFGGEGDENTRKLEIVSFLANVSQESGAHGPGDPYGGPGCLIQEGAGVYRTLAGYGGLSASGSGYCGRGPHQLSWNFNYGPFSQAIRGDNLYLDKPDLLTTDPSVGIAGSFWFWGHEDRTLPLPAAPFKPSSHDVITGKWRPTTKDIACGRTSANFGIIINIINGGIECGKPSVQADNRVRFLTAMASVMGVVLPAGFNVGCETQQSFSSCTSN